MAYLDPLPSRAEAGRLYEFSSYADIVYHNSKRRQVKEVAIFSRVISEVISRVPSSIRTLLDVGCSQGFALESGKSLGLEVFGIEIDPETALRASRLAGCPVFVSDGVGSLRSDSRYDLILMSHWLEHTVDPISELRAAIAHLEKSGVLLIRVPNATSRLANVLGHRWHMFNPPIHTFYFTAKSFEVAKDQGAFDIVFSEKQEGGHTILTDFFVGIGMSLIRGATQPNSPTNARRGEPSSRAEAMRILMNMVEVFDFVIRRLTFAGLDSDTELRVCVRRKQPGA